MEWWQGVGAGSSIRASRRSSTPIKPQASVTYRRQDLWIGNNASSPAPEWDLEIIVVWNEQAQHMPFDQNLK